MEGPAAATTSSPLRVAMPMMNYVPDGMGGSETYVRELAHELRRLDEVRVTRFVPRGAQAILPSGGSVTEVVAMRVVAGESAAARLRAMTRAATSRSLSRKVQQSADVIHYPFTVPIPRPRKTPYVVTLLDVQHLDLPEFLPLADRAYRWLAYDGGARQADAVITISEFCRSRIVDQLGIDPSRIHVIPLAVSTSFQPGADAKEMSVVYPARLWPHKNHERLISAMRIVRRSHPTMRLILTGGVSGFTDVPSWVERRGLVSEAELAQIYRRASCLVFPSLYEGFGLPVLEAMASGCPVACSTAGALPEVCGEAAVMFDPADVEGMAAAIVAAVADKTHWSQLGLERARAFTWLACAKSHLNVYQRVGDLNASG